MIKYGNNNHKYKIEYNN